jgi:hypothetical protein
MEDGLDEAFKRYAETVQETLGNGWEFGERLRATGILILSPDKGIDFLPSVVQELEEHEQFASSLQKRRRGFEINITEPMIPGFAMTSTTSFAARASTSTYSRAKTSTSSEILKTMCMPSKSRKSM